LWLFLCIIPDSVNAQHIASSEKFEVFKIPGQIQEDLSPLKDLLSELENTYKVNFGFENKVVEGKMVNKQLLVGNHRSDLEKTLESILFPLNLKHEKIKGDYYVIYVQDQEELQENKTGIDPAMDKAYYLLGNYQPLIN